MKKGENIGLEQLGVRGNFSPAKVTMDNSTRLKRIIGRFKPQFKTTLFRINFEFDKEKVAKLIPDFDFKESYVDINILGGSPLNSGEIITYDIHIGGRDDRYQHYKQETKTHYKYTVVGFPFQKTISSAFFLYKCSEAKVYISLNDIKAYNRGYGKGALLDLMVIDPPVYDVTKSLQLDCYGKGYIERIRSYKQNLNYLIHAKALYFCQGKWHFHNQVSFNDENKCLTFNGL